MVSFFSSTEPPLLSNTVNNKVVAIQASKIVWLSKQLKREQYHRLENRCVLRHISNMNFLSWAVFGVQGCREKKNPNCHKYATFEASFFMFSWAKKNLKSFLEYPSVSTEKLHDLKLKKWQFLHNKIIKNIVPVEFQNSMQVHRTADQVCWLLL
jgi:hypothetical protein